MTREEIMAMKPGRELDALVAEYVMGMRVERIKPDWYDREVTLFVSPESGLIIYSYDSNACNARMYRNGRDSTDGVAESLPFYSDDIAAAWQVVEKMLGVDREVFELEYDKCESNLMLWYALFYGHMTGVATGDTAPEAICKAALLTCGEVAG